VHVRAWHKSLSFLPSTFLLFALRTPRKELDDNGNAEATDDGGGGDVASHVLSPPA
jgi:hypothetical protein